MKRLPTMQIEGKSGPVTINVVDFDNETMKAYKAPESKKLTKKQQEAFDAKTAERKTIERDGKFFIVDGHEADVDHESVNADGYDSAEAADTIVKFITAAS